MKEKEVSNFELKNFKILSVSGDSASVQYDFYTNGKLYFKDFKSVWAISEKKLRLYVQSLNSNKTS